jgi:hypothetical protein
MSIELNPDLFEQLRFGATGPVQARGGRTLSQQVLKDREEVPGPKHPNTLTTIHNLALLLKACGHYKDAERLNRQALKAKEEVLGAKDPNTLASMVNLASMFRSLHNNEEAENTVLECIDRHQGNFRSEASRRLHRYGSSRFDAAGRAQIRGSRNAELAGTERYRGSARFKASRHKSSHTLPSRQTPLSSSDGGIGYSTHSIQDSETFGTSSTIVFWD